VRLKNFDHPHDHDASTFQDVVDDAAFTGGTDMSEERLAHFLGNHGALKQIICTIRRLAFIFAMLIAYPGPPTEYARQ
jgi:hypothetical protein